MDYEQDVGSEEEQDMFGSGGEEVERDEGNSQRSSSGSSG